MKWWEYIILLATFWIGEFQSSYSILVPMIAVNFGFPFSWEIEKETGLSMKEVRSALKKSVLLWFFLNTVALIILIIAVPQIYVYAYSVGVLRTLLYINKTKKNSDNISDFYSTFGKIFYGEDRERFDAFFC